MRMRVLFLLAIATMTAASPQNQTGSVEGTIRVSGTREPLRDVRVILRLGPGSAGLSSVTDSNGRFTIDKVPAGSYWIFPQREGYALPQDDPPISKRIHPGQIIQ